MAEKLDPRQVVTFEELLRAMMLEQDALRRVLVRKGLLTSEEVLEEIKAVRREMEGKRNKERRKRGCANLSPGRYKVLVIAALSYSLLSHS